MSLPRRRARSLVATLAGTVTAAALLPAAPAQAQPMTQARASAQAPAALPQWQPWPGHPDRAIRRHVVGPGDTATGLAVRYRAWTAELVRLNGLGPRGVLRQGQVLKIPVVLSAVRRDGGAVPTGKVRKKAKPNPAWLEMHQARPAGRGWLHADLSRQQVRRLVVRTARQQGVPPKLALAVAWQESGWQQRRVSSAGALGVMQVMPDTGRWMRWYVGRPLRLRDTHDNVLAGVTALRVLRDSTKRDNNAIAAYYQGLGAVRRIGLFDDTVAYVKSVRAHERQITRTGSPA